jgi:hypothetical protein
MNSQPVREHFVMFAERTTTMGHDLPSPSGIKWMSGGLLPIAGQVPTVSSGLY